MVISLSVTKALVYQYISDINVVKLSSGMNTWDLSF